MNTLRLAMTEELKSALDWLRLTEYPTLTYAEIVKAMVGKGVVASKAKVKKTIELNYSDPTPEELMRHAEYIFSLDEGDQDNPEVDLSKLKPFKSKWRKGTTVSV